MIQAGKTDDPSAFCNVVGLCARLEDVRRGEFWLNLMSRAGIQSDTCFRSFLDMCDKSSSKAAKASASRMVAKLDANSVYFTSGDNSLFLLKALVRLGHLEKAEVMFQAIESKLGKNFSAQGYQHIINAHAQEGNFRVAE